MASFIITVKPETTSVFHIFYGTRNLVYLAKCITMRPLFNLFFLVAVVLSGCTKNENNIPPAPVSSLKQLSFSHINSSSTFPPGPAQVNFSYDGSGRVNQLLMHLGDSGISVPATDTLCRMYFFYQGSAQLPAYAYVRKPSGTGIMTGDYHYFSYDANGRVTRDSMINEFTGARADTFISYSNDYCITETGADPLNRARIDSGIILNDNLVALYEQQGSSAMSYRYENDQKINPFSRINIAPVFSSYGLNPKNPFNIYLESLLPVYGKNNTNSIRVYVNGILTRTHTLWYTYNGESLPVHRIWSYDNPLTVADTLTFKY